MTDVTVDRDQAGVELSAADEQLLRELTERARTGGLKLTGEGGLLGRLTKMVIEGALEGEMDDHLGYAKHDPEGRDGGNSRNGYRAKTVISEAGPMELSVPRDRDSSFEPRIVAKRQRRLSGMDDLVISLSAKGLTHGEIAAHLAEVYGAEVSRQTITTITDRVMEGMAEWQSRPLDSVYAVIFIDAINVKIREGQVANRPIYLALGVTVDGERDVLGLWAGEHGDGEGAKYWLRVLAEIKNRGVRDVCMLVCDGLKGLPDAVGTVWEKTIVQTCIVHLLRNSFRYASKRDWAQIAKDLKPVYTAASESEALDRFAEFSGSGRSAIPLSYGSGRTRGRNSCRSCGSTVKSGPSSARQMRSNRLTPGCVARSMPAAISRPSTPRSSACTWRS
jgi:putative transposase